MASRPYQVHGPLTLARPQRFRERYVNYKLVFINQLTCGCRGGGACEVDGQAGDQGTAESMVCRNYQKLSHSPSFCASARQGGSSTGLPAQPSPCSRPTSRISPPCRASGSPERTGTESSST